MQHIYIMYRILTEFKVFMYWKDPPRANRDAEPVHEHRKTRLVSDLHNEESNLVVKSFKFDAMQRYVKVFSRDMTSDKPLHVLKEINFARFSLQQSLREYFPFKT